MAFWPKSMTKTGYKSMVNKETFQEKVIQDMAKAMAKSLDKMVQDNLSGGPIFINPYTEDPYTTDPARYYGSSIMEFISGGGSWAPGVQPIAKALLPTITCQYCENLYPGEIINKYHTCPTCGGGWPTK